MDDFDRALALTKENNAWSAQQAQKQMDFQERMSNTAHVREIEDLKAAGLNPVLSAKLGGASTPNGAMAQTDTSGTSAIIDAMLSGIHGAGGAYSAAQEAEESGLDPVTLFKWGFDLRYGTKNQQRNTMFQIAEYVDKKRKERESSAQKSGMRSTAPIPALANSGQTVEKASEDDPWYKKAWSWLKNVKDPYEGMTEGVDYFTMPNIGGFGSGNFPIFPGFGLPLFAMNSFGRRKK